MDDSTAEWLTYEQAAERMHVGGSIPAGALPIPLLHLFQVCSAPLAPAHCAFASAHPALRDMAMRAWLAGEVSLQAERTGSVTGDDVGGGDSHWSLRHKPVMSAPAEEAVICMSLASPVLDN